MIHSTSAKLETASTKIDKSGFKASYRYAQPGVDKYDDDDRFAVSELMDLTRSIIGSHDEVFYAEVSTVGNTIDDHGGSRVRRSSGTTYIPMIALTALSMIIGVLPR
jgi:hypothetical protein